MRVLLGCAFAFAVVGCQSSIPTAPGRGIAIGGMVTGLAGDGLVLQNNGSDSLDVSSNSSFWFPTRLAGGSYDVTVSTQPSNPTQTCTVAGGSGTATANGADVSTVVVNCASNTFTVGGTISGLSGTVVLENSNGDRLSVTSNGSFAFPTAVTSGASYRVSIVSQPDSPTQYCGMTGGTGTVAGADVTSVALTCATNSYPITGTLDVLNSGDSITLSNDGEILTLTSAGAFSFPTPVASGSAYDVAVVTQPATGSACTIARGSGTVASDIVDVAVQCLHQFPISTVCGLSNTEGIFCSGNCTDNHAQYADAYCQLAGYTQAYSYTLVTTGNVPCVYYDSDGVATAVPTACGQVMFTAEYGLDTSCDAVEDLVCE